jgi:hypothetical protein
MRAIHGEVAPGDTVWLAGGTYTTAPVAGTHIVAFDGPLSGAAGKPITISNMPGARVTLDASVAPLGHNLDFRGLEIVSLTPQTYIEGIKDAPTGGFFTAQATQCRLINCVLHDGDEGATLWTGSGDNEVYGCVIYHNGVAGPTRGHGHGIYAQGPAGTKRLADNIIFNNYGYGIHCFSDAGQEVNDLQIIGNILFSNGMPASAQGCTNILVGSQDKACRNILVSDNISYMHPVSGRLNTKLYFARAVSDPTQGYTQEPNEDLICTNNVLINGRYALNTGCWKRLVVTGNLLYGRSLAAMMPLEMVKAGETGTYEWDRNEYIMGGWIRPFEFGWGLAETTIDATAWRAQKGFDAHSTFREETLGYPKGVDVYVRPNQYEPGRAHIAVLNWDRQPMVSVNLKEVLKEGQAYRIFNVQNLWDEPVASGTYDGKPVAVPALLSWLAPEFDAYLVIPSAEGAGR